MRGEPENWEHGIAKPPMWVRLLSWVALGTMVAILAAPAALVLIGRG
jgi:hypothetical protein